MAIPDYFIQELKSRNDIVDVVSQYVTLKRSGKNYSGLCPFHGEKTASFSVNAQEGYFHCFGCHAGGDVITFIRRIENLEYIEAIKFLANRVGMQLPDDGYDDSLSKLRARLLEVNRETARFFYQTLMSPEGSRGLNYLKNRGLSLHTIKKFGLGYSPESRFGLVNHLKSLGYKKEEMEAANVAFLSRNGNPVDRFVGRVMFPIINLRGDVIAFGGRALGDEKAKYINTSDTVLFHKNKELFALNFAKNSKEKFILAEGYMDVISLHAAGFTGAVAALGTAFGAEQAKLIAKYRDEVILCLDSDQAGQNATQKAIVLLREAGLNVKVVVVPGGKDPDEFIKKNGDKGASMFKSLIEKSENDVEYRLEKIKREIDVNTPQGKIEYLTKACTIIASLENDIEKDVYAGILSEELKTDKSAILNQANKFAKTKLRQKQRENDKKISQELSGQADKINPDKAKNLKVANAEEALIAYVLSNPEGITYCREKINPENFCTSFGKRVYSTVLGKDIGNRSINLSDISGDFNIEEIDAITKTMVKFSGVLNSFADADRYIQIIKTEGTYSNADNIKNASPQELAQYISNLKNLKK
ncbi:MAG: DNA primase [Clostridia bacterium]